MSCQRFACRGLRFAFGDIGMSKLVDKERSRRALQCAVEIKLRTRNAPIAHCQEREPFEAIQQLLGF